MLAIIQFTDDNGIEKVLTVNGGVVHIRLASQKPYEAVKVEFGLLWTTVMAFSYKLYEVGK